MYKNQRKETIGTLRREFVAYYLKFLVKVTKNGIVHINKGRCERFLTVGTCDAVFVFPLLFYN
jgi:hypothetical protein